jgi:hypothetical protein
MSETMKYTIDMAIIAMGASAQLWAICVLWKNR